MLLPFLILTLIYWPFTQVPGFPPEFFDHKLLSPSPWCLYIFDVFLLAGLNSMMVMKVKIHATSGPMAFLCPLKLADPAKFLSINYNNNNNKKFFRGVLSTFIMQFFSLLYSPWDIFYLMRYRDTHFSLLFFLGWVCFCVYKSPSVLVLSAKKESSKKKEIHVWGWNCELEKSYFLLLGLLDGLLCAAIFWGYKDKSILCSQGSELSADDQWINQAHRDRKDGHPQRAVGMQEKGHLACLEGGRTTGIRFQR